MRTLHSYVSVLATLVRDAPNMLGSVFFSALSEWTTDSGMKAFKSLGHLQRYVTDSIQKRPILVIAVWY